VGALDAWFKSTKEMIKMGRKILLKIGILLAICTVSISVQADKMTLDSLGRRARRDVD